MSNMKCPFCQQAIMCMDAQDADERSTWYCPRCIAEKAWYAFGNETLWQELIRTHKALDYCIERFKSLENVLDEKAEASDIPDNPDLYAWAVRIKTIWLELKEITGIDYKTALEQKGK